MIPDLITAFLVAFAAVTASETLTRIWEDFGARAVMSGLGQTFHRPPSSILLILEFAVADAVLAAVTYFVATL